MTTTTTTTSFKSKIDYFIFVNLVAYYILITTVPFFEQITSAKLSMAVIFLLFAIIIIANPERYIILLIPLIGIVVLDTFYRILYNLSSVPLFLYGSIILLLPALISYFLMDRNNTNLIKFIVYFIIGGLLVTSITSYYGLLSDPMAARIGATISDSKDAYAVSLNMRNIGDFSIVYTIVAIYPMIVCLWKYKKINVIIFLTLTVCFGGYIFMSQYATALIFFCGGLSSIFISKRYNLKKTLVIGILVAILYLIFKPLVADVFYSLSNNIESITLSLRFQYIADIISSTNIGTNDVQIRFDLFQYSIDSFKNHPIVGFWLFNDGGRISGHSFILDIIAKYGLFGLGILLIYYKQIHRKFYLPFKKEPFFGYMLYCYIISIFLGVINPINSLITITLIVPLIGYVIRDKIEKDAKKTD